MSGISPSIEHPLPIIKDFDCAMTDFGGSLERQMQVAEAISHDLWKLLDGRWFKAQPDASLIELLREEIVALSMRATVLTEALYHHAHIFRALEDAAPAGAPAPLILNGMPTRAEMAK